MKWICFQRAEKKANLQNVRIYLFLFEMNGKTNAYLRRSQSDPFYAHWKKDNKLNNIPTYRSIHTLFAICNNMLFFMIIIRFFFSFWYVLFHSFQSLSFYLTEKKNNNEYLIKGLDWWRLTVERFYRLNYIMQTSWICLLHIIFDQPARVCGNVAYIKIELVLLFLCLCLSVCCYIFYWNQWFVTDCRLHNAHCPNEAHCALSVNVCVCASNISFPSKPMIDS